MGVEGCERRPSGWTGLTVRRKCTLRQRHDLKIAALARTAAAPAKFYTHTFIDRSMNVATIIPVRNRAKFIERALDSVAAQTYPSKEIIVVDDASTDTTADVVRNATKRIPNIRLVSLEKNVGASEARNIGARRAHSEIIAFLDSDDKWYEQKLEKQIREFERGKDVVAVFSGSRVIYKDRSFGHVPAPEVTLADLYYSNKLSTTSSALISRSAFVQVGGFDPSLPSCEDWDLFLRLAEIGRIRVVQEELIEFFNHDEKRISNTKSRILSGHEAVHDRIYRRIADPVLLRKVRGSHHSTLADIFSSLIYEPGPAIKHAILGLALWRSMQSARILARAMRRILRRSFGR